MNQTVEHNSLDEFGPTLEQWDRLLRSSFHGINGSDTTNSVAWARSLCDTYWNQHRIGLLSIGPGTGPNGPTGLMPYVRVEGNSWRSLNRQLQAITTLYAGRSSFIVQDDAPANCESLLQALPAQIKNWDTLQLTIVDSSSAHQAIHLQTHKTLLARSLGTLQSPYIQLGDNWDETFNSLPKKLRWTIRKSEKDLAGLGTLTYREYASAEGIDELFAMIYAIEQQSWKEESGTSITAQDKQRDFYEAMARHATRDGTFSAHVLLLDDKPLAYILGLVSGDGSFLDLKESFVQSHSKYSPAHVLKRFAFPALIAKGVRIYDFMGVCEPYKMRWTDKVYQRHTIVIYNKTLRGRLAYLKSLLSKNSKPVPAPGSVKPVLQETDS